MPACRRVHDLYVKGCMHLQEVVSAQSGGTMIGATKVGHIAHLGGALVGVLLILLLSRLPDPDAKGKAKM